MLLQHIQDVSNLCGGQNWRQIGSMLALQAFLKGSDIVNEGVDTVLFRV